MDCGTTITVSNDVAAPNLERVAYDVQFGNWTQPPHAEIAPGKSNTFSVQADDGGTEGEVTYRRTPGVTLKIYFKCSPDDHVKNVVTVTPADDFDVTYNESGNPLVASINVLPNDTEKPDGQ